MLPPLSRLVPGYAVVPMLGVILAVSAGPARAQSYIQPSGMTQGVNPSQAQQPIPAPQNVAPASADPVSDLLRQRGESYRRASDERQNPEEVRTTSALNAEVSAQSALIDNADAATLAEYDAVQRRYQDEVAAADAARRRYEAESRAAEDARLRYERDRADWEAMAAACRRGDRLRCRAGGGRTPVTYPDRPLPPGEPVG